jgi:predicted RNA-binding Zn ribbon-like protein
MPSHRASEYAGPLLGEPVPLELLNTLHLVRHQPRDGLSTPAHLADWLRAIAHRLDTPLTEHELKSIDYDDLAAAHELRDCVGRLVNALRQGTRPDPREVEGLNRHVRSAHRWRELRWAGDPQAVHARNSQACAAVLSEIAQSTVDLLAVPDRVELRVCEAPGCILYFARSSPRRTWCSDSCGNRVRAARHYARSQQQAH